MNNDCKNYLRAKARRTDGGGEAANHKKSIAAIDQVMKGPNNG